MRQQSSRDGVLEIFFAIITPTVAGLVFCHLLKFIPAGLIYDNSDLLEVVPHNGGTFLIVLVGLHPAPLEGGPARGSPYRRHGGKTRGKGEGRARARAFRRPCDPHCSRGHPCKAVAMVGLCRPCLAVGFNVLRISVWRSSCQAPRLCDDPSLLTCFMPVGAARPLFLARNGWAGSTQQRIDIQAQRFYLCSPN